MKKLIVAAGLAAACAGTAVPALAADRTVKVGDDWFLKRSGNPHTITISKGTRLVFRWVGDNHHNVTATRVPRGTKKFASKTQTAGTYRKTLRRAGRYTLVCTVHGADKQKLTVKVR